MRQGHAKSHDLFATARDSLIFSRVESRETSNSPIPHLQPVAGMPAARGNSREMVCNVAKRALILRGIGNSWPTAGYRCRLDGVQKLPG